MERMPVQSSNILEIGYDSEAQTLEVMFKNESVYQYYNVPDFLYEQLMSAPSHGSFFNNEIRGHFPEARM